MIAVMVCPVCGERTNVELNREWNQLRCQQCGELLERAKHLEEAK